MNLASMGPRSDERGNTLTFCAARFRPPVLQWGRAPMSAEITTDRSSSPSFLAASMGPRSDERGNEHAYDKLTLMAQASMGPRSDERGNLRTAGARGRYRKGFNGAALR